YSKSDHLVTRDGSRNHNHLAVVQFVPAAVIGPLAQLGEADSRIHCAHAGHSTSSNARLVPRKFVGISEHDAQNVAEITAGVRGEVRTFFNPQILRSSNSADVEDPAYLRKCCDVSTRGTGAGREDEASIETNSASPRAEAAPISVKP